MTRLRRVEVVLVALSLVIASCATVPPTRVGPQVLRLSTYRWAGPGGADPGPGAGWGKMRLADPAPLPAQCTLSNDRGSWTLTTPGTVEVLRSAAPLQITCRREGYREAGMVLRCITPRAAGTAGGAYIGLQFAAMSGPAAVVLVPAGVAAAAIAGAVVAGGAAGAMVAEAGQEPDVCAYGAGAEVQVWMDPGP